MFLSLALLMLPLAVSSGQQKKDPTGITFEEARGQAPYAPVNLGFDSSTGRLSWSGPNGVYFRVYRLNRSRPIKLADTKDQYFVLASSQRKAGTCFKVASISEHGVSSDLSEQVCLK